MVRLRSKPSSPAITDRLRPHSRLLFLSGVARLFTNESLLLRLKRVMALRGSVHA